MDNIRKEMTNNTISFHKLDDEHQPLTTRLIYNMQMNFEQKGRLVTGWYTNHPPAEYIYIGMVSMKIVHLILTVSVLNNLSVCALDIQNAYLTAP